MADSQTSGPFDYDTPCRMCGKPVGDHTLRGYADELRRSGADFHMPFAETPGALKFEGFDGDMAGAIFVKSAVLDTVLGKIPCLGFQFIAPSGESEMGVSLTPIWLVMDADSMRRVTEIVGSAVDRAILATLEGGK